MKYTKELKTKVIDKFKSGESAKKIALDFQLTAGSQLVYLWVKQEDTYNLSNKKVKYVVRWILWVKN